MDQRRILLVDDDQEVLVAMSKFLERRGFSVVTANSSASAMEAIVAGLVGYDLVLADIAMPQLDGREILKAVKRALPSLPVLLIGGYGDPETRDEVRALGAAELLPKPFTGDHLLDAIQRALAVPATVDFAHALS